MRFVVSAMAVGLVVGAAPAEAALFGGQVTSSTIAGVEIGQDAYMSVFLQNSRPGITGGDDGTAVIFAKVGTQEFRFIIDGANINSDGRSGRLSVVFNAPLFGGGANSAAGTFLAPIANESAQYTGRFNISGVGGVSFAGSVLPPVPEPATWAMMIAGFGAVGATVRRRRTYATS